MEARPPSPTWKGELPEGVNRVIQGDSDFLGSLTRTQLFEPEDLPNVQKIQAGVQARAAECLSGRRGTQGSACDRVEIRGTEGAETTDEFWAYVNFLLPLTTPNPQDKPVQDRMAEIGLVAGKPWDSAALGDDVSTAIAAGMQDALAELKDASTKIADPSLFFRSRKGSRTRTTSTVHWVSWSGIFGNVKKVSVYFAVADDDQGELFDGSKHNYTVTFAADQIPPAKNFWSWTMYKLPQRWLVDNPINRYSIGSSTPGLNTAADGSITIYFQAKSPGKDKESNWLPAPEGPFWPILRTYGPGQSILHGSWKLPQVRQADLASHGGGGK